ncbi:MAG: cyclodeaminase/cyclohydrolase family protein [Burkholderiaceae bacterium]|nr:cyclodeaminase/cyclohydrolase family protein [Burkholderiaceae bacterium]
MDLHRLPIAQFCEVTASDAPAPGGGSVSALCGALAASLSSMVANLTIGRKGYEPLQKVMQEAIDELESIRQSLLKAIDEDSKSFDDFMAATRLPKTTDEEKAARKTAMQQALKTATLIPLQVARESAKIFDYARLMLDNGNPNAFTDAMVSTLAARTATLGALLNVRINLASIKDEDFIFSIRQEIEALEKLANEAEAKMLRKGYLLMNR